MERRPDLPGCDGYWCEATATPQQMISPPVFDITRSAVKNESFVTGGLRVSPGATKIHSVVFSPLCGPKHEGFQGFSS